MRSLLIACSVILVSFAANAQTAPAQPAATNPTIVFVNSDTLVNNYTYYKDQKVKLQKITQQAQAEIQTKGEAFQKKVTAYQKNANNLAPAVKAATEKRLAKEQQDLQLLSQNTGKQLQDMEVAENLNLYGRISSFLKNYSKTKGYKLVLTYSATNPNMLYGDESLDVTKEVLAGLNDEYSKAVK